MSIAKQDPSTARTRHISIELIEQVRKNRVESYTYSGEIENMIPWDELTVKERFWAIQAFAD